MKEQFVERVSNKCDGDEDWFSLKRELLDIASGVCGCTKVWMWLCVGRVI